MSIIAQELYPNKSRRYLGGRRWARHTIKPTPKLLNGKALAQAESFIESWTNRENPQQDAIDYWTGYRDEIKLLMEEIAS